MSDQTASHDLTPTGLSEAQIEFLTCPHCGVFGVRPMYSLFGDTIDPVAESGGPAHGTPGNPCTPERTRGEINSARGLFQQIPSTWGNGPLSKKARGRIQQRKKPRR